MNRAEKRRQRKLSKKASKNTKSVQSASSSAGQQTLNIQQAIDLALQHHSAGRLPEAEEIYQQILLVNPSQIDALHLLGVVAHQRGKNDIAVGLITEALTIKPDFAEAHNNLGNSLKDLGKLDEAAASYQKAFAIKPDYVEAHYNLGNVFRYMGKLNEAVESYYKALAIKPDYTEIYSNLGLALQDIGKLDEAVASYHQVLAVKPDLVEAHNNLGLVLQDLGKLDEAVASYHKALAIEPGFAEVHNNLGLALYNLGKLVEAVASYDKSLAIEPDYAKAHSNLGNALKALGKLNEAVASYHQALAIKPDNAEAHSNLVFCMNYDESYSQQDIFAESCCWEAAHAFPSTVREAGHTHNRDPERRLRIGYVSPDFQRHSVSYFVDALITGHDRNRVEVFCYAQVPNPDDVTRRFQGLADSWCSTVGMTTPTIAERIRSDNIDILVDLAGHTANNRLLVFAEHPAPVQIAWLGYPNTTGLTAMDYRLTDHIADPQGSDDALYSETLTRLPNGFLCFTPEAEAPAVADPPVMANGHVTFGSFNNLSKVTAAVVVAWARILEGVPRSRLLLKNLSFADEETRQRYRALFAERGVDEERLEFHAGIDSKSAHLEFYERIDVGLDPFPYNGTTTTCEALWMGVPVISLRGDRHASRVGASILTRVGLGDLIADSVVSYVGAAVTLAETHDRLVKLRRKLRTTMVASPLCDAAGFTHDVEAAYREMWRSWCQSS